MNETLILLCKEFENNTPFLSLLDNHNTFNGKTTIFETDTIQHNINFKKALEKIKNYFMHTTHSYTPLEEICFDILQFICSNVTFLMDFCLLLYISEYAGKTMEDCNVMIIEMGKNSDSVSDNDYSSDSKTQLHLNFQKKIYQLLKIIIPS